MDYNENKRTPVAYFIYLYYFCRAFVLNAKSTNTHFMLNAKSTNDKFILFLTTNRY